MYTEASIRPTTYACPLCPTQPWPHDYEEPQTGVRVRKGDPGYLRRIGTWAQARAHFLRVHGREAAREYGFLPEEGRKERERTRR